VYDQTAVPGEEEKNMEVRKFNANRMGDMVLCMAASKHHNLVATGNAFGNVNIWELDSARIICMHKISNEKITFLGFMD